MSRLALFGLVCLPALVAAADVRARGPIPLDEVPAPFVSLGRFVVELEKTTLRSIMDAAGRGVPRRNGRHPHDGGGNEVCYLADGMRVIFTSNGEFGGAEEVVTDFRLEPASAAAANCANLPTQLRPVRVAGWLALGATRKFVEDRFDTALGQNETTVPYHFSGRTPGGCGKEDADIEAWLDVTYSAGIAVRIAGGQTTTC